MAATAVAALDRARIARVGLLLALATLLAAMRLHTFGEPIQRDLLIYAFVGEGLFAGGTLYDQWIDLKPPGPYLLFGAVGALTGVGHGQMLALGLGAALATLAGLYGLFAGPLRAPWAGVAAAALWVAVGSDLWLEANEPNTEAFINAFLVAALALLLGLPRERAGWAGAIAVGALFAAATTFKHVAIVPAVLLCLAHLVVRRERLGLAFAQCAIAGSVVVATWLAMAGWFAAQGRFSVFWETLVLYPAEYGTVSGRTLGANLLAGFAPERFFDPAMGAYAWGVVAVAAASVAGLVAGRRREWTYLAAFLVGTCVAVAAPGWFFPHYDQLWLPALAIGLGLALVELHDRCVPWPLLAAGAAALVLAAGLGRAAPQYRLDARAWSEAKYQTIFTSAEDLGRALAEVLRDDERLHVHGVLPNLYLAAGRRLPTGVANVWFTLPEYGRRLAPRATERLLADLERSPPDVIVLDGFTLGHEPPELPVRAWIERNYRRVAEVPGFAGYALAVRHDADPDLVARIEALPSRMATEPMPPSRR
jgi:hypothetical protein